jgi:hypothetical protein
LEGSIARSFCKNTTGIKVLGYGEGNTARVKEILKMRNMLKRGNKELFNGDAFFLLHSHWASLIGSISVPSQTFRTCWSSEEIQLLCITASQKDLLRCQIHGQLEYRLANV